MYHASQRVDGLIGAGRPHLEPPADPRTPAHSSSTARAADDPFAPTPPALHRLTRTHGTHAGRTGHRQLRCPGSRVRPGPTPRHAAPLRLVPLRPRRGPRGHRGRRRGAHRGAQGAVVAGQVRHQGTSPSGSRTPASWCGRWTWTGCRRPTSPGAALPGRGRAAVARSTTPTSTTTCSRRLERRPGAGSRAGSPASCCRRGPRDRRRLRGRRPARRACAHPASTCCPSRWSGPAPPTASTRRPARSRRSSTSAPTSSRSSCTPAACRATSGSSPASAATRSPRRSSSATTGRGRTPSAPRSSSGCPGHARTSTTSSTQSVAPATTGSTTPRRRSRRHRGDDLVAEIGTTLDFYRASAAEAADGRRFGQPTEVARVLLSGSGARLGGLRDCSSSGSAPGWSRWT